MDKKWYEIEIPMQGTVQFSIDEPEFVGKKLQLGQGKISALPDRLKGAFSLRSIVSIDEIGTFLEARLRVADKDGNVWETISTFHTTAFTQALGNDLKVYDENNSEITKLFDEHLLVEKAFIFNDGHYGENFLIDEGILNVYYKYTNLIFDIAFHAKPHGKESLAIRIEIWAHSASLNNEPFEGKLLSSMPILSLFKCNTVRQIDNLSEFEFKDEAFEYSPIPYPLVFKHTNLKAEPQQNIIIV